MPFRFTKMHGCGNDYVYVDSWSEKLPRDLASLARQVSDRHTGIGADGLILLAPSRTADARMLMYNADGSASEMCGNGIRCLAKLAWDHRRVRRRAMRIETGAGIREVELEFADDEVVGASVLMGRPRLTPAGVPVRHHGRGPKLALPVTIGGVTYKLLAVGMGNPHAVCFVDDPDRFPVTKVGPALERHPRFPNRTNVEFVSRLGDEAGAAVLRQRTWERGSGETQACGTGACAAVVAAIIDGRIEGREATVRLNGGDLRVTWLRDDAEVRMSGPAVSVYRGEWGD
jgi:diaminopimelate epimerase